MSSSFDEKLKEINTWCYGWDKEIINLLEKSIAKVEHEYIVCCLHGLRGLEEDEKKAFELAKKYVDQGNEKVQMTFIALIRDGLTNVVRKNQKKASQLSKKYAEQGNQLAQLHLVKGHLFGIPHFA